MGDAATFTLIHLSKRLCLAALLALLATGCLAERHLVIETTPPGALVELDWEPVGRTPLELVIDHSGKRRLLISLEGYEPVLRDIEFESSWENSFPIDIFTELLNPAQEDEVQVVELTLRKRDKTDSTELAPVLERAESLRRAGPSGPGDLPEERE